MIIDKIKDVFRLVAVRRALVFIITFFLIYSILITSLVTKKYGLSEGDIAKANIKASREIRDENATEALMQGAIDSVPLQYIKKLDVRNVSIDNINKLILLLSQLKDLNTSDKDKFTKLKSDSPINLSDDDFNLALKFNKDELKLLKSSLQLIITNVYDSNISEDNLNVDTKKAQDNISTRFNSLNLNQNLKVIGINIGYTQIKPNFFYDKDTTESLRNVAMKKVQPVVIKKGQIIVKEGEPVTKYQLFILKDLDVLNTKGFYNLYIEICLAMLVLLILFIIWFYIYKYHIEIFNDWRKLTLISILICISLVLARTLSIISPFLIPLSCMPMLMTLLLTNRVSLTISIITCILISTVVGFDIEITLLAISNAVLGVLLLKKVQQRNDIILSSLCISALNVILTFSVGFLLNSSITEIGYKVGFAFLSGIISGILTIGILPFFESFFGIVTTIKLLELSNPNNPLLKRLLMEAPGTYHHSIMVANIAEVAADAIGANSLLTRVSSYYHDIGKLKRPYFFSENQMGNANPHNKITPNLSTLIITSHAKDGIDLAKQYKVPQIIQDAILQHHGTTLVKYFYINMKNKTENSEDINEEDFRYLGPSPKSKEVGIIMLADSIEASVRSIPEPTIGKIEEMVSKIIKERLNDGQLDDCELTLKDIRNMKIAFLKVLTGIYHQRVEYPTEKLTDEELRK